jgi:sortase A
MSSPIMTRSDSAAAAAAPPPLHFTGPSGPSGPSGGVPRRPGRIRRWMSLLLIVAGLALGADVILTLLWQEPVTALIATIRRSGVDQRFTHAVPLNRASRAQLASIDSVDARIAYLARREAATAPFGAALGTLRMPAIGVRYEVVQGADASSLELGPGHYADTDLPGEGGTTAVAGHRTTYLAPFKDINELKPGDQIQLSMSYGDFSYVVQRLQIVTPASRWILRDAGYDRLVLSSCNPLFSAAQRIVVFARLSGVTPTGQAWSGATGARAAHSPSRVRS